MNRTMIDLTSRAEGAFLGLACGNALGLPFQDIWPAAKIRTLTGGVVRDIPDTEAGSPWDDETAQAELLARHLAETGKVDPKRFARDLIAWKNGNGRGMSLLTEKVLDEIEGDIPPFEASEEACDRLGRNWSAENGSMIRAVPVAIFSGSDRAALVRMAGDAAKITHWNPLCVGSTTAYALALADALEGKVCDIALLESTLGPMGFPEAVSQAVSGARLPPSKFQLDGKQKGFAIKALQVGLWALRAEGSIEDILEQVILEGGDTDANAAIAGASVGARHGIGAIPERWIAKLHEPQALRQSVDALLSRRA